MSAPDYITLSALLFSCAANATGQTIIQGDSLYNGLRINEADSAMVISTLGGRHKSQKIIGTRTAKLRSGGCIDIKYVASTKLHYYLSGVTCYVRRKNDRLVFIDFDSTANVASAKGIQPSKHNFGDVIKCYGPVDFKKKNNSLPKLQEISWDNEYWMVALVYPNITFVSSGKRKPGENLLLRPVTNIWLGND